MVFYQPKFLPFTSVMLGALGRDGKRTTFRGTIFALRAALGSTQLGTAWS